MAGTGKPKAVDEKKGAVNYSVISKGESFRRSGFLFSKVPTILTPDQITDEILNEQMLIVTKVAPEVKEDE
jgi:hypothetical protein